jgi:hypothetical protein
MTIEQTELSNTDKQQLAELAERTGNDAVRVAVNAYLEQRDSNGAEASEFEEDTEYLAYCMEELRGLEARFGPEALTDEEAHRILAKVSGSIVDVLNEDRGER